MSKYTLRKEGFFDSVSETKFRITETNPAEANIRLRGCKPRGEHERRRILLIHTFSMKGFTTQALHTYYKPNKEDGAIIPDTPQYHISIREIKVGLIILTYGKSLTTTRVILELKSLVLEETLIITYMDLPTAPVQPL